MRRAARLVAPAVLCLGLAACAGGGWRKDGAAPEAVARDLGECRALAYDLAARPNPPDASAPPVALDSRFGTQGDGPVRPTEIRLREQQLVDGCMRDRGYRFEPAAR